MKSVRIGSTIIILIVLAVVIASSLRIVEPGRVGVVTRLSKTTGAELGEGTHFVLPFGIDQIQTFSVRSQKYESTAQAASQDLQQVEVRSALNYRLQRDKVSTIFQTIGRGFIDTIVDPTIEESVKSVTAQFTAADMIGKRSEVKAQVQTLIASRLTERGIIVEDFSITNLDFSEEFDRAIEAKQVAQQQALKAQQDLERVKFEAEAKLTQARAEADGQRLQRDTITAELVKLREVEAQIKAIEKWDGKLPQYTGSQAVPFIQIPN